MLGAVGATRTALPAMAPVADVLVHGVLGVAVYAAALFALARVRTLEMLGLVRGAVFGLRS
jgi:hypothetical protein